MLVYQSTHGHTTLLSSTYCTSSPHRCCGVLDSLQGKGNMNERVARRSPSTYTCTQVVASAASDWFKTQYNQVAWPVMAVSNQKQPYNLYMIIRDGAAVPESKVGQTYCALSPVCSMPQLLQLQNKLVIMLLLIPILYFL